MAKADIPLLFVFSFFISVGNLTVVNGQKNWCVAKPSTDVALLLKNIDYACRNADCGPLKKGGPCFYPETPINHASVAMNIYYKTNGGQPYQCDFANSGLITTTDPSYSDCIYI